ncbi:hypothetical protein C8A05DRAFT_45742 [Staphylotrichum tortipilum]|uniref:Uncharacterized protein n=1 Tax=Staphylotrichum tortipilum TaxID=2831512 RepID=A0AAN6MGR4_9PEZI|nr:hypothetical protein C8A05DRAFT_45742 [Staphylotrichum longicolle]
MEVLFDAPELLILVFQSFDRVDDALSLASTCQFLASIWRTHTSAILCPLIETKTPGFNQALIAVRITDLVFTAFETNHLPPLPPPPHTLSVHARKPNIAELKHLLDLRHLARCVEHMYRRGTHADQMHESEEPTWLPTAERAHMSARFQCAVYRVLVAGAVLTREYLEPLFMAREGHGPEGLLRRLQEVGVRWEGVIGGDCEFLERFAVYDLEGGRERWEGAFGELAGWLVEDMEGTFIQVEPPYRGLDAEQLGRLQEVTFFLAAYEHVKDKLFYKYAPQAEGDEDEEIPLPPPLLGGVRKAQVAMFGIFCPEVVWMPERVEDVTSCYLVNKRLAVDGERMSPGGQALDCQGPSPWEVDVPCVLEILHTRSGRLNHRDGHPSPPPALRFVEYVLGEFFKVRFKATWLFDLYSVYSLHDYTLGFLQNLRLFGDRSIMTGTWLFTEDKAPSLSYRPLYG